jgi:hypothetical protein
MALHGRRFAGAVTAEQRHGLALPHRKTVAEQNLARGVEYADVLDLSDRLPAQAVAPACCTVPGQASITAEMPA